MSASPALPAAHTRGVSLIAALWALYGLTLRQHLHGKRWLITAALFLLPACLALVVRTTAPNSPPFVGEFVLAFLFIPQALLPLVALIYASGVIRDEQEEQTITYLLVRPIPKWAIYLVKLLATMTTTVILTIVFTLLTYAAIFVGSGEPVAVVAERCLKAAAIHSLAVVAYCSLFGLLGLVMKRILVAGIVYTAIVEGLLSNLPFGIRLATVIYYTRIIAYRSLDFMAEGPGQADLAAEIWQLDVAADPQLAAHPSLATCFTILLLASLAFVMLAAWLCTRREFHVKTPESE